MSTSLLHDQSRKELDYFLNTLSVEYQAVLPLIKDKYAAAKNHGEVALANIEDPQTYFFAKEFMNATFNTFRKIRLLLLDDVAVTHRSTTPSVSQKLFPSKIPTAVPPKLQTEEVDKMQRTALWAAEVADGISKLDNESSTSDEQDWRSSIQNAAPNQRLNRPEFRAPKSKPNALSAQVPIVEADTGSIRSNGILTTPRLPNSIPVALSKVSVTNNNDAPSAFTPVPQKGNNTSIAEESASRILSHLQPTKAAFKILPANRPRFNVILKAVVSDCASLAGFHVQIVDEYDFERFCTELNERYQDATPMKTIPSVGSFCITKFSTDSCFYRAKVINIVSEDKVEVLYVDYGNTETVELNDVYEMDEISSKLRARAIKCRVKESPNIPSHALDASDQIREIFHKHCLAADQQQVQILFISEVEQGDETIYEVDFPLRAGSGSESNYLSRVLEDLYMKEMYATDARPQPALLAPWKEDDSSIKTKPIPPSVFPVTAEDLVVVFTEVRNPSESYVRLSTQIDEFCLFEEKFNDACATLSQQSNGVVKLHRVAIGSFFAAKYNNVWSRALVTGFVPSKRSVKVIYVDYGNVHEVLENDLCPIPDGFCEQPACCHKIRFFGVEPVGASWSSKAIKFFNNMVSPDKNYIVKRRQLKPATDGEFFEVTSVTVVNDEYRPINDLLVANGYARGVQC